MRKRLNLGQHLKWLNDLQSGSRAVIKSWGLGVINLNTGQEQREDTSLRYPFSKEVNNEYKTWKLVGSIKVVSGWVFLVP